MCVWGFFDWLKEAEFTVSMAFKLPWQTGFLVATLLRGPPKLFSKMSGWLLLFFNFSERIIKKLFFFKTPLLKKSNDTNEYKIMCHSDRYIGSIFQLYIHVRSYSIFYILSVLLLIKKQDVIVS